MTFDKFQNFQRQVGHLPIHNWKFDFFLFNIQSQKSYSFKSKKPRWFIEVAPPNDELLLAQGSWNTLTQPNQWQLKKKIPEKLVDI